MVEEWLGVPSNPVMELDDKWVDSSPPSLFGVDDVFEMFDCFERIGFCSGFFEDAASGRIENENENNY